MAQTVDNEEKMEDMLRLAEDKQQVINIEDLSMRINVYSSPLLMVRYSS